MQHDDLSHRGLPRAFEPELPLHLLGIAASFVIMMLGGALALMALGSMIR